MRELLEELARRLVDQPEKVSVDQFTEDDGTVVLELAVADDDYGKIIGRGGRTANALRMVVKAAAVRENKRVLVDIVEGGGARRGPWRAPARPRRLVPGRRGAPGAALARRQGDGRRSRARDRAPR